MGSNMKAEGCQVVITEQSGSVQLPKNLTVIEAVAFKQAFQELCQGHPDLKRADLDLTKTQFIDSSGIGAIVNSWKTAKQHKMEFALLNVAPQVMMALSLAGLDQMLDIRKAPIQPEEVSLGQGGTSGRRMSSRHQLPATHPSVRSKTKRFMDVLGAVVGLGITGVLFVPIAIAIKLEDGGPILFGQTRCSLMGRHFRIWKFRSMVTDAEALKHTVKNEVEGALFKNENDPRITKVGRFLRKTSLDEFPQFWNVLKGDMSLVGTRPPTPDELERYEVPQWQRLNVKPGITGEWQVYGRSSIKNFEDVIRLDLRYQEKWSLKYDLELIFKTVAVIFDKESGAY